jgi:hypothetical protein
VKKDEIKMLENGTSKIALFTYTRWAQFTEYFEDIDSAVVQLVSGQPDIKLRLHVGGGWCMSVTSGYR